MLPCMYHWIMSITIIRTDRENILKFVCRFIRKSEKLSKNFTYLSCFIPSPVLLKNVCGMVSAEFTDACKNVETF